MVGILARLLTPASAPALTTNRIRSAYAVAAATDLLQLVIGPSAGSAQTKSSISSQPVPHGGFSGSIRLLLPTFMIEFLPMADVLPTWTGCVALVVAARKARQGGVVDPPPPGPGQVIDV